MEVRKGIFGENTRVAALGDIRAQYVQDASIMCRGNAMVGSYLYNGKVRAGESVTVHGRGDKGGIVGGEVRAKTGIVTTFCGSEYGVRTRLCAGVDDELTRSIQKVKQSLDACRENMQKIVSMLNANSADAEEVRQAVMRFPRSRRKAMRVMARRLEELPREEKRLDAERMNLKEQQQDMEREAQIRVNGTLFHNVDMCIGEVRSRISDPIEAVNFRLSKSGDIEAFSIV